MKKLIPAYLLIALMTATLAQRAGDHPTAGITSNRTHLNAHMGDFKPPLRLFETIDLAEVASAGSLVAFEGRLLVGETGSPGYAPARYHLYSGQNHAWTVSLPDGFDFLGFGPAYEPAYAAGRVLLGGARWQWQGEPDAVFARMVDASSGATIWENSTVGDTALRSPVVTGNLAIFHGEKQVVAADGATGEIYWQFPNTTESATTFARAPVTVFGDRVYVLGGGEGRLYSLDIRTGDLGWVNEGARGTGIIATEKLVYAGERAIDATSGETAWTIEGVSFALAYGQLFASWREFGHPVGRLRAYRADTGELLWERAEPVIVDLFPMFDPRYFPAYFPVVANNLLCFYNPGEERVRVLDVFTGTLLWSIHAPGLKAMAGADGRLLLLFDKRVESYVPSNEVYFPQVAGGQGITTLLILNNLRSQPAAATIHLVSPDGSPLSMAIDGWDAEVSEVSLVIPAESAAGLQILDGGGFRGGWARVVSDAPLRGTAIFQSRLGEEIQSEVGVADSPPTGVANVRVDSRGDLGTALAIVNTGDEVARLNFRLLDEEGTLVAEEELQLLSQTHMARFFDELFDTPGISLVNFEGTLVLESDIPVSITALRTRQGAFISSYPVGQPVR
jgi:outer membrane protein assembly factor BamB